MFYRIEDYMLYCNKDMKMILGGISMFCCRSDNEISNKRRYRRHAIVINTTSVLETRLIKVMFYHHN